MSGPALVAHADWSVDAKKRWMAAAVREGDTWRLRAPVRVNNARALVQELVGSVEGGSVLLGFDFPIGLPRAYADRAAVKDFVAWLLELGTPPWDRVFDVCRVPEEITEYRPFYPHRAVRGIEHAHLINGLDVGGYDDLRRVCERKTSTRGPAESTFWTAFSKQVGKAALSGWSEVLIPALRNDEASLWPFHGHLDELLALGPAVIAETYPAEFYGHLGIKIGSGYRSKRNQADRRLNAEPLVASAKNAGLVLEPETESQLRDGFGPRKSGEDPFDAMVGLVGMLNVLAGRCPLWEPTDPVLRRVEGWIFGQAAPPP